MLNHDADQKPIFLRQEFLVASLSQLPYGVKVLVVCLPKIFQRIRHENIPFEMSTICRIRQASPVPVEKKCSEPRVTTLELFSVALLMM
jgi:hypothetical protein